jgi:nucleotide-binding universal stress UspA family protein
VRSGDRDGERGLRRRAGDRRRVQRRDLDHDGGRPREAIVEYVTDHEVDHVVMGSRGRTDDPEVSLGSVAETVLQRARARHRRPLTTDPTVR